MSASLVHFEIPAGPIDACFVLFAGRVADEHVRLRAAGREVLPSAREFEFWMDLSGQELDFVLVEVWCGGRLRETFRFPVEERIRRAARRQSEIAERKRAWCLAHLAGGAAWVPRGRALAFVEPVRPQRASIAPYDPVAATLVEAVRAGGGKVLDCGAGFRSEHDEAVINLDICDYPSTDVLASAEALPFEADCFDAVIAVAVLEHVADPFRAASELARVLKAGGSAYVQAPFLQPEHGYPSHFYNMTRAGLANLFRDKLRTVAHFMPRSGRPMWGLHWLLRRYLEHLPPETRRRFESLTVRDIVSRPMREWLDDAAVLRLTAEGNRELACATALLMTKPLARSHGVAPAPEPPDESSGSGST